MTRRSLVAAVLAVALLLPVAALAHTGHAHNVLGTVATVQGTRVDVKATDGKVVTVILGQKTTITRGKAKLDVKALVAGERVSIDYTQDKNVNTATAIKLGTAPAAAK